MVGARTSGQRKSSQTSDTSNDFVEGRLLDGFLLLAAGGSSSPDEVVRVNLSSLQLVDVATEDLAFFAHLDKLDASDNQLSYDSILQQMGRFPRVTNLILACNSIPSLQVPMGTLRQLQHLDLSFNELHGDVMGQLARLTNLVTLNLSRNCISSVPPEEELYGLQALEELILDSNDLVQFIQWRALDALPKLRKLSLASNRVKKLKDDAPDQAPDSGELIYFPQLEELNLSSNEIEGVDFLPVVHSFGALKNLILNDNPCTKGKKKEDQKLHGMGVSVQEIKPFYLKGGGCHQARPKRTEPKLKMNRNRLRKVRSSPHVGVGGYAGSNKCGSSLNGTGRAISQLGVLDSEANHLKVNLGGPGETYGDEDDGSTFFMTNISSGAPPAAAPRSAEKKHGILSDELSDGELEALFQERREYIDKRFNAEVEEPTSFMRAAPFESVAAFGKKLHKAEANDATRADSRRPSVSNAGEDAADEVGGMAGGASPGSAAGTVGVVTPGTAGTSAGHKGSRPNVLPIGPSALSASMTQLPPRGSSGGSPSAGEGDFSPNSTQVILPPIRQGSRVSSATGQRDSSTAVGEQTVQLPPAGPGGMPGGKSRAIPDVSVRDAMRALRAAAASEFAKD